MNDWRERRVDEGKREKDKEEESQIPPPFLRV